MTIAGPDAAVPVLAKRRSSMRLQELGLVVVVLVLGLFLTVSSGSVTRQIPEREVKTAEGKIQVLPAREVRENKFLRTANLVPSVLTVMSWMAVMAIGVTIVIISGGIDISVGSIMGLSALGCAAVLQRFPEDAPALTVVTLGVAVPVGIGLACGLLNGLLVVLLRMHPFIVTLATLSIFRGIAQVSVKAGSLPSGDASLPRAFTDHFVAWEASYTQYGGQLVQQFQPVPVLVMLGVLAAGWVYLGLMVWGRETYAVGGNEEASRFSGINVSWVKLRVYLISGLCAGVAGMLTCGFYKSAATNTGEGYELIVVAAAVVGGAALAGGRGTALGAVLGMLVIQLILNGVQLLGDINLGFIVLTMSREYEKIIVGIAIIIAVAVNNLTEYLRQKRLAAEARHR